MRPSAPNLGGPLRHTLLATLAAGMLIAAPCGAADKRRQRVQMPVSALASFRDEMLANLCALHEISELMATGKVTMAGEVAERELGVGAMGKNRALPLEARPGAHMPQAMHALGLDGHQAASRLAREAAAGDGDRALAALPELMTSCVASRHAYRVR